MGMFWQALTSFWAWARLPEFALAGMLRLKQTRRAVDPRWA